MKKITVEWKYYAKDGKTCQRCTLTGNNLHSVMEGLRKDLLLKNIELELIETVLPKSKIPESNSILIDGIPIEQILPNTVKGESTCCSCGDLCGEPTDCRTINLNGQIFEEIPAVLIKEAIMKKLNLTYYPTFQKGNSMKIQVFGSGCESCKNLHKLSQQAVSELGIKTEVEYVTDIARMMEMGFMTSPVLAVDGKAVITGYVPNLDKIKEAIKNSNSGQKDEQGSGKKCSCGSNCC